MERATKLISQGKSRDSAVFSLCPKENFSKTKAKRIINSTQLKP